MKTLIACNTLTAISSGPYMDHARFFYRLGKDSPQDWQFSQFFARRMSIDRFRNAAFRIALDNKLDYLMFIDDDMMLPHDTFFRLQEANCDIIAAFNYIRGYPYKVMNFKLKEEGGVKRMDNLTEEEIAAAPTDIVECDAVGTAVCLIKMENLRELPAPWFVTGPRNTEDIYFCCKAKDYYPDTKIAMHRNVITGHQLDPEYISFNTKRHLAEYHESYEENPEVTELQKTGDRGAAYVKANFGE